MNSESFAEKESGPLLFFKRPEKQKRGRFLNMAADRGK